MYETMEIEEGVGLAAPQVGVRKRLFTYDLHEGDGPNVVINPEIVEMSGEQIDSEGCLSVPGFRFEIVRADFVTIRGLDLDGNEIILEGDDLLARMIQHEIDHLDGVLVLDRIDPDVRREALREMRNRELPHFPPVPPTAHDWSTPLRRPARPSTAPLRLLIESASCASSSSAHLTTRFPPCARSTRRGTTSRSWSRSPIAVAGGARTSCRAR